MEKKKKLKLKKSVIFKSIAMIVCFFSLLFFIMFLRLNILPWKFLLLILLLLIGLDFLLYKILSSKNYRARLLGTILSFILLFVYVIGISYQNTTISFLHKITFLNIQTEIYQIYIKNSSSYTSLSDLNNKTLNFIKNELGIDQALKEIKKESKVEIKEVKDSTTLIQNLINDQADAIIIEKAEAELYKEMISDFRDQGKMLKEIKIDIPKKDLKKEVSLTKEPFSIYITGVDTYDGINTIARSDVNMIITINPITHKILLTSIPRDYYVQISGTTGLKDKLTHAGLKGVETSIKTIEDLLELDINYYMKFNFTALVDIVDAIGGIDVDSPFAFTADYQEQEHIYYEFQKGINHLNGKQALAYCRERYGLREGDVARAKHQQQVIKAMIEKASSTKILTKYGAILGSIEGNFMTNMEMNDITSFIQMQLEKNPTWEITNQVLRGSDDYQLTASIPNLYSAVMIPNEESVKEAISKINEITD